MAFCRREGRVLGVEGFGGGIREEMSREDDVSCANRFGGPDHIGLRDRRRDIAISARTPL